MESITIIPNVDRQSSQVIPSQEAADQATKLTGVEMIGIPRGTESGQPAVIIAGTDPETGKAVYVETTFALVESGVRAIAAAAGQV